MDAGDLADRYGWPEEHRPYLEQTLWFRLLVLRQALDDLKQAIRESPIGRAFYRLTGRKPKNERTDQSRR